MRSDILHETELCRLAAALARTADRGQDTLRSRAQRRSQGAFFTPPALVEFVVAATLEPLASRGLVWREDGSPMVRVLDPAAGDGRFLAAAVRWLTRLAVQRGADPTRVRAAVVCQCVVGIERDPEFAATARRSLGAGAVVHCTEALVASPGDLGEFDAVVGNPPYLRSIHMERSDPQLWRALRGRYAATSFGEWDLYAAFLEQSFRWLNEGGEVGLVVPSRWLTSAFAGPLRGLLAGHSAVRAVVDFGAWQLFPGATTYASVALLSRTPAQRLFVARWGGQGWTTGELPAKELGQAPWRLSVGARRAQLQHLVQRAPALGEVARIVKGAGTNADRVFVLEQAHREGPLVRGYSRELGEQVSLEAAAARPCLRGRDVRVDTPVTGDVVCVVPYDHRDQLLTPEQLELRWPYTAAYLARCRGRLEARESGRFRGPQYYCFGRPQNLAFFRDPAPKVVVPDVAREGRALLDDRGGFVLDSAYAIRLRPEAPSSITLEQICDVLNSGTVALWLRETGVQLRGNYLRMKTAYLRSLPLA